MHIDFLNFNPINTLQLNWKAKNECCHYLYRKFVTYKLSIIYQSTKTWSILQIWINLKIFNLFITGWYIRLPLFITLHTNISYRALEIIFFERIVLLSVRLSVTVRHIFHVSNTILYMYTRNIALFVCYYIHWCVMYISEYIQQILLENCCIINNKQTQIFK